MHDKEHTVIIIEDYIFQLYDNNELTYEYPDGTRIVFDAINPLAIQLYVEDGKYWAGVVTKEALYRFKKGFDESLQIIGLSFKQEINAVKAAGLLMRLLKENDNGQFKSADSDI